MNAGHGPMQMLIPPAVASCQQLLYCIKLKLCMTSSFYGFETQFLYCGPWHNTQLQAYSVTATSPWISFAPDEV
jgi:hypothetical protein